MLWPPASASPGAVVAVEQAENLGHVVVGEPSFPSPFEHARDGARKRQVQGMLTGEFETEADVLLQQRDGKGDVGCLGIQERRALVRDVGADTALASSTS